MNNKISTKLKITATIILILLMASVTLMAMPAQAQVEVQPQVGQQYPLQDSGGIPLPAGVTPSITVNTLASISFRPNPIGLGQPLLVNLWMQPALHASRYFKSYTVTFTKPDGTKDTKVVDSFFADATAWFEYTPDQVGTWKIKFDFLGAYYPAGIYCRPKSNAPPGVTGVGAGTTTDRYWNFTQSAYYKPSSTEEQIFIVQQDMVWSWPESPLPTDYWTRPVSPENREWWPILGNYPGSSVVGGGSNWPADTNTYTSNYNYIPYVQGPNTAHIVWKRQDTIGGLIGGQAGPITMTVGSAGYASATNIPTIIYAGRCYQTMTKPMMQLINGTYQSWPTSVWECYDLRTGQVYWDLTGVTAPTLIEYYLGSGEVPGGGVGAMGMAVSLMYIGGGRLLKYDPWTGACTTNVSIAPLTTGTYYKNMYALTVQTIAGKYYLINWTTGGPTSDLAARIVSNVTWPFSSVGTVDYESGMAVTTTSITPPSTGVATEIIIMAASLKTGQLLWNITSNVGYPLFSGSTAVADHGKFAVRFDDGLWRCWDLYSGKELWVSELSSWPWGTFGCYGTASYGGLIIANQYDGVAAYNWTDGKLAWFYQAKAPYPYETVYQTNYPFFAGAIRIADGKYYVYNVEHTPSQPFTRGWRLHCINATTGEGIWNITGSMMPGGIADGYLTAGNLYDGYMYVFGKGKSATTVTASQKTIASGESLLIEGSVLDQSPAQPGTPCVSKDSMATYMEFLQMQKPIPSNYTVTGVPVTLLAVDSNGNVIDIGATVSDVSGKFQYAWTPPKEGMYKITATFAGDDSYGLSWDETAVSVGPAPAATVTPTQTPLTMPPFELYTVGSAIAIIIAIAIVGLLILRKRPLK